ncbi:MAG: SEC-C metal-binding domain-containing protein [Lentisphaeria bacterium]|nr:SEC-C metal-binding domain-containing protein [Lentisphaeria bacterium]
MGAMADAMAAYAQPLLDETDGSLEQMQKAFDTAMLCWNLAVLPEAGREKRIADACKSLATNHVDAAAVRRNVVEPMIRRYNEMFPDSSRLDSLLGGAAAPRRGKPSGGRRALPNMDELSVEIIPPKQEKFPGTSRNAPCPCGSGLKYKRCCGKDSARRLG